MSRPPSPDSHNSLSHDPGTQNQRSRSRSPDPIGTLHRVSRCIELLPVPFEYVPRFARDRSGQKGLYVSTTTLRWAGELFDRQLLR